MSFNMEKYNWDPTIIFNLLKSVNVLEFTFYAIRG